MEIKEALEQLDHNKDDQWTGDGLPLVSVVSELVGDKSLTRAQITAADPSFIRKKDEAESDPFDDTRTEKTGDGVEAEDTHRPGEGIDVDGKITAPATGDVIETGEGSYTFNTAQTKLSEEVDGINVDGEITAPLPDNTIDELRENQEFEDLTRNELEQQLSDLREEEAEGVRWMEEGRKRLDAIRQEIDKSIDAITEHDKQTNNTDGIQEYLASQHRMREEKVAARTALLGGLDYKDLNAKAPIDQAFTRRNTRGTARPVRG